MGPVDPNNPMGFAPVTGAAGMPSSAAAGGLAQAGNEGAPPAGPGNITATLSAGVPADDQQKKISQAAGGMGSQMMAMGRRGTDDFDKIFHSAMAAAPTVEVAQPQAMAGAQPFKVPTTIMNPGSVGSAPMIQPPAPVMSDRRVKTNIKPAGRTLADFLDVMARNHGVK